MWNIAMNIWMLVTFASCFYAVYQANIGKAITWKEVGYFLLGLYLAGMPFFYYINNY